MTIAIRILWWVWTLNIEGSFTRVRKKDAPPPAKTTPPRKPKHTHHYTGKYPTGFQPNPPAPTKAEAPTEPEDPEEAGAPTTAGAEDGSTDTDTGDTE